MDRNDCIIGQIIDRAVNNTIQQGFTLIPETGDAAVDNDLFAWWTDFATNPELCDVAGEMTWHDFELKAARAMLLDGDCVITGTDEGSFQFFEAHEIQTKTRIENVFLGVELDDFGKRERYYVCQDEGVMGMKKDAIPLEVRNELNVRQLFHVFNPKRTTQTRGVTALAPVFSVAGMFEDLNFAKLVQAQVVSMIAIFRENPITPTNGVPNLNAGYGASSTETTETGETRLIEGLSPGIEVNGKPGQKLHGFSPNVPNSEFFNHVRLLLQLIGTNVGLPLCLVLMDGSETNFAGWRGAVDEARKGFRVNQAALQKRWHKPGYEWAVARKLELDGSLRRAFERGVNVFGHRWNAPTFRYIQPEIEVKADIQRLGSGLTSPRRITAEQGNEWETLVDEQIKDYAYAVLKAKQAAASINQQFKDDAPVTWRDLVRIPMTTGTTMTMQDPQVANAQAATAEASVEEVASA
jgi:capsid protein